PPLCSPSSMIILFSSSPVISPTMANAARRSECMFKGKYAGLVIRRGHKRSIIALGHKILKTIFILLSRKEHYRDSTVDYEAMAVKRNAPRWISTLRRFGYLSVTA
ncbi:MAG: hypothetical protein HQL73_02685, partial [Magnetococcales bacterium]|nr:hypothetical protein [Magnetococcales bacterium]